MKIVIDEVGNLSLERAGEMKKQYCPFTDDACCGDWCPHFGEPDGGTIVLSCGEGREWWGDIEDRRKREAT
jgi:hypothetical protein